MQIGNESIPRIIDLAQAKVGADWLTIAALTAEVERLQAALDQAQAVTPTGDSPAADSGNAG